VNRSVSLMALLQIAATGIEEEGGGGGRLREEEEE
jgi:hypothetical protein